MSLQKKITLDSGVAANYHRISGVFVLDRERLLEIHLESFPDEDTRREMTEKGDPRWTPLARPVCRVQGEAFNALFGEGNPEYPHKSDLYAYLKTEPQFVGAVDA